PSYWRAVAPSCVRRRLRSRRRPLRSGSSVRRCRSSLHTPTLQSPTWATAPAAFAVPKSRFVWPNSFRLRYLITHPAIRRHAGEAGADFIKLYDRRRVAVENKSARAGDGLHAELRRGGHEAARQRARDLEQRARESVRQQTFVGRVFDFRRASRRDVAVEEQHVAIVGAQRH